MVDTRRHPNPVCIFGKVPVISTVDCVMNTVNELELPI